LGKALAGGFYPVSAVVARREVLEVFKPGSHGSTFGGNPLGCAVARAALGVLEEESLAQRSAELGAWFLAELQKIDHPDIKEVRGLGLLVGFELKVPARRYCERLQELGLLCKETHDFVIRIAPPLVVKKDELEWAVGRIREAFAS
jgi:ornithine--oxo-acid transaminase